MWGAPGPVQLSRERLREGPTRRGLVTPCLRHWSRCSSWSASFLVCSTAGFSERVGFLLPFVREALEALLLRHVVGTAQASGALTYGGGLRTTALPGNWSRAALKGRHTRMHEHAATSLLMHACRGGAGHTCSGDRAFAHVRCSLWAGGLELECPWGACAPFAHRIGSQLAEALVCGEGRGAGDGERWRWRARRSSNGSVSVHRKAALGAGSRGGRWGTGGLGVTDV
jgi:hypothetical protein